MQGKHLFEYAVVRVVPRVEREEFINVGVVLYCSGQRYLKMKYVADSARIAALWSQTDVAEVCTYLDVFGLICAGTKNAGPIARLGIAERFRWLTATRSTVVQCSKVHPGFCDDADAMLAHLFAQLVS